MKQSLMSSTKPLNSAELQEIRVVFVWLGTAKFGSSHNMRRASATIFAIKIREKLNTNFANKFHFQKLSGHGKFLSLPAQVWSGKFSW